jgi:uncharacterized membrane protein YphA (DoxX/SURF4 family)
VVSRILLAVGFIPTGLVKVLCHRFTSTVELNDPISAFFEVVHRTGAWWRFIGWGQLLVGVCLLVPRITTPGAVLFLPLLVNMLVLTVALHFTGTPILLGLMPRKLHRAEATSGTLRRLSPREIEDVLCSTKTSSSVVAAYHPPCAAADGRARYALDPYTRHRRMRKARLIAAAGVLLLVACATAGSSASRSARGGVRFTIGTAETPAPSRGALGMFDGVVEFAGGRGRLEVTAPHYGPAIAVQGRTIAAPLASAGDYYLFDSTGFVLVRPASRTFSAFALSESSYRLGDVQEPREGFMEFSPLRADTLAANDSALVRQHGPYTVRWHLDRRHANGPAQVLARGWIELPDAPPGEASVVRWFGAAAALSRLMEGASEFATDSLQVTAAIVLPPTGNAAAGTAGAPVTLIVLHPLSAVSAGNVDLARLVLPAGFTERPWTGFDQASGVRAPARDAGAKWSAVPGGAPR